MFRANMRITGVLIFSLLALSIQGQALRINEVVSKNYDIIYDSEGNDPDWIELYNQSNEAINLHDYYLSDDEGDFTKWRLPNAYINPGVFVVVFAGGASDNVLSANFSISSSGETIYLYDGTTVEPFEVPHLLANQSYGIGQNGLTYYQESSPGLPNELGVEECYLHFSEAAGFYQEGFDLHLEASMPGAEIRYTIDGSDPTTESFLYDGAINVESRIGDANVYSIIPMRNNHAFIPSTEVFKCTPIAARGFINGSPVGRIYRQTFFVDEQGAELYTFPVISLSSDPENFFNEDSGIMVPGDNPSFNFNYDWERPVSFEYFEEGELQYASDAGIRIHGNGSRYGEQKSLRLHARSDYGNKKFDYPFFPEQPDVKYDVLILKNISARTNKSGFTDELAYDFTQSDEINVEGSPYKYIIVFLDGEYWGVYTIRERVDKSYIKRKFDIPYDLLDYLENVDTSGAMIHEGNEAGFVSFINNLESLDVESAEFMTYLNAEFDVDNFLDYFVLQTYLGNYDWPKHNINLFNNRNDPSSKWTWLLWDADYSFISSGGSRLVSLLNEEEEIIGINSQHAYLFRRIFENEEMRQALEDRMYFHLENTFCPEQVVQQIDEFTSLLEPEIEAHILRFGHTPTLDTWYEEIESAKEHAEKRPRRIVDYFNIAWYTDLEDASCEDESDNEEPIFSSISEINTNEVVISNSIVLNNTDRALVAEIWDLSGKKVNEYLLSPEGNFPFRSMDLASGVYLLSYDGSAGKVCRKILVR